MESFVLIIFGITGNLAQIKLIPALYDITEKNLLPKDTTIIGISRQPKTRKEFKDYLSQVLHSENKHHKHPIKKEVFSKLLKQTLYLDGNVSDAAFYHKLSSYLNHLSKKGRNCQNKIFYLATYPDLYQDIFKNLKKSDLSKKAKGGWTRLMIEKPIGNNLKSARSLNNLLLRYFNEDQLYRLDHYLGKETLLNILTFRFKNEIFEPAMNTKHIDHIQIIASEDFGVGARGNYYDSVGALKDVGQNHLLQMIAIATMKKPVEFTNESITKERIKIIQNLVPTPSHTVLGQYEGYTQELNIAPNSKKDTFFAFRTELKDGRFKSIPIYVRGGKYLKTWVTEISIFFKSGDILIYRIQPNEGIVLQIKTKKPGFENEMESSYMQFCYKLDSKEQPLIDPYERLIYDAIRGDQTNFNDSREVEAEWKFIDELEKNLPLPANYQKGTWGPEEADEMIRKDGREWLEPSMEFCRF